MLPSPPGLIGVVTDELEAQRLPHGGARAVGADDVTCSDGLDLALVGFVSALDPRCDRVNADIQPLEATIVVGDEPVRRLRHDVEEELMHARLVDDHVRIRRKPVLDVLDHPGAHDLAWALRVRLPECGLVDPIGLALDSFAHAESLEHFHRTAGDAVGLPDLQGARLLLNNAGPDLREPRELSSQSQACRAAADDQHVNLFWQDVGVRSHTRNGIGVEDFGIAGTEPVEIELHIDFSSPGPSQERSLFRRFDIDSILMISMLSI